MGTHRYAVSSHIPGREHQGWHWPSAGPVEREDVIRGMPPGPQLDVVPTTAWTRGRLHTQPHAWWVVVQIAEEDYNEHDGAVEFSCGTVVFNGPCREAAEYLHSKGLAVPRTLELCVGDTWADISGPADSCVIAGEESTARVGDGGLAAVESGLATAGDNGIAVGRFGSVQAGNRGLAVTVYGNLATAGEDGLAWSHEDGISRAGTRGLAVVDELGTAIAGDLGIAVAKYAAHAEVGREGIAIVHEGGTGKGALGALLVFAFRDQQNNRRFVCGTIGEAGVEPDIAYRVDEHGAIIPASADRSP